jgi:hypothetical protein
MKFQISLFPVVALTVLGSMPASADDVTTHADIRVPQFVHVEYDKSHQDLATKAAGLKKKMVDMDAEKSRIFADAKSQQIFAGNGIEAMKKYDVLVEGRYANDKGEYERGLQLAQGDVDNINKLFQNFMNAMPLQGRVSAGQARRTIAWGMEQLKDREKLQSTPLESNNSDLEIIGYETRQAERQLQVTIQLAAQLGLTIGPNGVVASASKPGTASPSRSLGSVPEKPVTGDKAIAIEQPQSE